MYWYCRTIIYTYFLCMAFGRPGEPAYLCRRAELASIGLASPRKTMAIDENFFRHKLFFYTWKSLNIPKIVVMLCWVYLKSRGGQCELWGCLLTKILFFCQIWQEVILYVLFFRLLFNYNQPQYFVGTLVHALQAYRAMSEGESFEAL